MQLIFGLCLLEVEGKLQHADIAVEFRHGVDAPLIENKGIAAAVCVGGIIVNHGLVGIGHVDILMSQRPTRRLNASLGGSGRGIGVEIIGIGKVVHINKAIVYPWAVGVSHDVAEQDSPRSGTIHGISLTGDRNKTVSGNSFESKIHSGWECRRILVQYSYMVQTAAIKERIFTNVRDGFSNGYRS